MTVRVMYVDKDGCEVWPAFLAYKELEEVSTDRTKGVTR